MKNGVQFDNIAMINIVLNFYFFDELMDDFIIIDLFFSDNFDGKDESCFLVSNVDLKHT